MDRLHERITEIAGADCWFAAIQDIWLGEHWSQYQYVLLADNTQEIADWGSKVEAALKNVPLLKWVTLDQQLHGLKTDLIIDRSTAARLGLTLNQIDNTLFDAFGERQVSTIYAAQNQYHVVMGGGPQVPAEPGNLGPELCQHQRRCGQRYAVDPTTDWVSARQVIVSERGWHGRRDGAQS